MSFWENVGETIGYGLGVVVFGPKVALQQRAQRTIRRSFAGWLSEENFTKQEPLSGHVRRFVERQEDELPFVLECDLAPREGVARIVTTTADRLPDRVRVRIERDVPPIVLGTSLEAEATSELIAAALASPLRHCAWRSIEIGPDRIVLETNAPSSADEWEAFARGALKVATWLTRRFRGDGYR